MTYHTQAEISETWDQMRHGAIGDGSKIVTNERLTQALRIPLGIRYRDSHSGGMSASYLRQRGNEASAWEFWRETL
jgi:hypothetical protein